MKTLLTFCTVILLNGAFLYPLFCFGSGRQLGWWWELLMVSGGASSFYLLVKCRKRL